jgi:hypothetical protein
VPTDVRLRDPARLHLIGLYALPWVVAWLALGPGVALAASATMALAGMALRLGAMRGPALLTGRTVPALEVPPGLTRIGNSPRILRYLWGEYCATPARAAGRSSRT